MTRYFFNIRSDAELIPDDEGIELPDLAAAETEAKATVRDLARASMNAMFRTRQTVEIINERGEAFGSFPVTQLALL